jgi:hypothetical protein
MSWAGPYKIGAFLNSVAHRPGERPPEKAGVYIVCENPWKEVPAAADGVLYVGRAPYLRYQIGRLLCDLLGFTGDNPSGEEAYQHKGGHALWSHYCLPRRIEPANLYLGWCAECLCLACAEMKLLEMMRVGPHRTTICTVHRPALELRQNCCAGMALNFDGRHW